MGSDIAANAGSKVRARTRDPAAPATSAAKVRGGSEEGARRVGAADRVEDGEGEALVRGAAAREQQLQLVAVGLAARRADVVELGDVAADFGGEAPGAKRRQPLRRVEGDKRDAHAHGVGVGVVVGSGVAKSVEDQQLLPRQLRIRRDRLRQAIRLGSDEIL